jgi:hypothetical protein
MNAELLTPPFAPQTGALASLREDELLRVAAITAPSSSTFSSAAAAAASASAAVFERRWPCALQGVLNLCRTAFLCTILGVGAVYFSKDANRMVLQPIKRMVAKVEEIANNPLKGLADAAAHAEADAAPHAAGDERRLSASGAAGGGGGSCCARRRSGKDGKNYETRILELSINKICSLMAVGFGDAGAEIIAENMRNGGALNPMVPGKKMYDQRCACISAHLRTVTDAFPFPFLAAAPFLVFATSASSRTPRRCFRRR